MWTYIVTVDTGTGSYIRIQVKANTYDEACGVAKNMYGPKSRVVGAERVG